MGVSCIVDSIAGKIGLVSEQNVMNHTGVRINSTAQIQTVTHVRRFKMLNVFDVVQIHTLLENVPLQTRQIYYQHDGAPPHFSQVIRQYLDHKFPNRWIGLGGTQNWPPRSPDLNQLDYHVWGYIKAMGYEHKLNTREELLLRILSAARS